MIIFQYTRQLDFPDKPYRTFCPLTSFTCTMHGGLFSGCYAMITGSVELVVYIEVIS